MLVLPNWRVPSRAVARLLPLLLLVALNLSAGTIRYTVTDLGANNYRYSYFVQGFDFLADQELDIRFDPTLYGSLSNGLASADFDLLLLQPDNPTGTDGDYSALALRDHPSLAGPFSVEFVFIGEGLPGPQPFFVNAFDTSGNIVEIESGMTVSAIPEPSSGALAVAAALMWGVCRLWRRSPAILRLRR